MNLYEADQKRFEAQILRIARFFRVALHCHSPLSPEWSKRTGIDKARNDGSLFLKNGGELAFIEEV